MVRAAHRGAGPGVAALALASGAGRADPPCLAGQRRDRLVGPVLPAAVGGDHVLVDRHRQHVGVAEFFARFTEPELLAVDLIRGHPPGRDTGVVGAAQHHHGQFRLRREPPVVGDTGRARTGPRSSVHALGRYNSRSRNVRPCPLRMSRTRRSGSSRSAPRCPSTAGPPQPTECPSSKSPSRQRSTHHPAHPGAPSRNPANRHGRRPDPSPSWTAAAASRPASPPRPAPTSSTSSCVPRSTAAPAGTHRMLTRLRPGKPGPDQLIHLGQPVSPLPHIRHTQIITHTRSIEPAPPLPAKTRRKDQNKHDCSLGPSWTTWATEAFPPITRTPPDTRSRCPSSTSRR